MKGTEVYAEVSLGGELYEVKMKIVPSQETAAIKSQETRADEARREQTQPEARPSGHISNTVLITRVTNDAPEIKILETKNEVKLEEISIRTCSREEELMRDMHQETPQPHQHEHTTTLAISAPTMGEGNHQQMANLRACLDRLEKRVVKLQTVLEAKKDQSLNKLEREKPNTTHTKCNLNPQDGMEDRADDKSGPKGNAGAHNRQSQVEEHEHEPRATEYHQEEG